MPDFLNSLDRDALRARGITGWSYGYEDQVRFAEVDALAHVNNVAYLSWFEVARVRYFQALGLSSYSAADPQLVVRAQTADYLAPMFQDERYVLVTRASVLKASSMVMGYAVYVDAALKATGSAVVISLERDGKSRRDHYPDAVARIVALDAPQVL